MTDSSATGLTSDMRRALYRLRQARPQFGVYMSPDGVPAGTARALERRGLARIEGKSVHLTDAGRPVADEVHAAMQRVLHGDGAAT